MTSVPSGGEVSLEVPGSPWETPTPASEGSSLRKDLSGTASEVMEGIRKVSSISSLGRRPTFEEIDTEILQKLFVSSPLPDLRRLESGGSDKEDVPEPPELDLQADELVNCAGLEAARVARLLGGVPPRCVSP